MTKQTLILVAAVLQTVIDMKLTTAEKSSEIESALEEIKRQPLSEDDRYNEQIEEEMQDEMGRENPSMEEAINN